MASAFRLGAAQPRRPAFGACQVPGGLFAALVIALLADGTGAVCPFGCSGHGLCKTQDVCECFMGYIGFACSQSETVQLNKPKPIASSGQTARAGRANAG